MSVSRGQFERKLAELDATTRDLPNEAAENAERPLSSVLEFLADEALAWKSQDQLAALQPQLRVLRKLVSLGLLKPLDRLGVAACKPPVESSDFGIPCKPFNFNFSGFQFNADWFHDAKVQVTLGDLAEVGGLRLQEYVLPSGRWAQGVYRAVIYAQAKKGAPADRAVDLTKLCASPASGPLCCLSAAAAATEWPLGVPASLFANLGKTKLTLAEFQNDYRPLLDGKSLVGEYLLCLADVLRGLEADEVETLVAMLKTTECLEQPSLDALAAVAAVLRQHREGQVDQALAASLDQLWQLGLREQIAKWLDQLADEPKSPSVPAAPAAPGVAGYGVYQAAPYGKYPVTTPYWVNQGEGSLPPALVGPPAVGIGDHQGAPYGAYPVTPYGADSTAPGEPAAGYYGGAVEAAPAFSSEAMKAPPIALDGYCPVTLVENRMWQKGKMLHSATHYGRLFFFASANARETFLKDPDRFAPEMLGMDVVQLAEQERWTPGKREFGVFYRDQIWLFTNEGSLRKFEESPETYMAVSMAVDEKQDAEASAKHSTPDKCEDLPSVTAEESPADDSAAREKKYRYGEVSEGYAGGSPEKGADAQSGASLFAVVIFPEPGPNDAPPPKLAPGQPQPALDGFSPVTLVELQKWRAGDPRYVAAHRGRVYFCASEFERQAFLKDPDRYAIANDGLDLVEQIDHQRERPGKREFAAYWNQQLFLFASRASRDLFERNWKYHMVRHSDLSVENLGRGDRYANRRGVSEAINKNPAAPSETAVQKKPARVGRRRAFGRRFR
jgi:YHS domain-containing protein